MELADLKHSPLNLADLNFNQELITDDAKIQAWKGKNYTGAHWIEMTIFWTCLFVIVAS
jgi:hypothetical protein